LFLFINDVAWKKINPGGAVSHLEKSFLPCCWWIKTWMLLVIVK